MRPRGKLLVLVLLSGAIALTAATGAFTTVEAQRTVNVGVSGDDAALLQIQPAPNAADYVSNENGQMIIDIGSDNSPGINVNAKTSFGPLLNITNQGTNDVGLYVEISGNDTSLVEPDWYDGGSDLDANQNATAPVDLNTGQSIQLTLSIDLIGEEDFSPDDDLDVELTIIADAGEHSSA